MSVALGNIWGCLNVGTLPEWGINYLKTNKYSTLSNRLHRHGWTKVQCRGSASRLLLYCIPPMDKVSRGYQGDIRRRVAQAQVVPCLRCNTYCYRDRQFHLRAEDWDREQSAGAEAWNCRP